MHFKRYLTRCCKANSPPNDLELTSRNWACKHSHYCIQWKLDYIYHINVHLVT
jgi:hypothetical protein